MRDTRAAVHVVVQPDLADHGAIYHDDEISLVLVLEMLVEFLFPCRKRFRTPGAIALQDEINIGV